jgi:RNA polymerase primary sigma factor
MHEKDIEKLVPYVKVISNRYKNLGVPFEDLVQEGIIGVIKAREHFNPKKKVNFSAYAIWWIKQSILDCLSKQGRIVHHPFGKINLHRKIREVRDIYINTFHREPSDEEIKKELQLSEEEFFNTIKTSIPIVSIDNKIDDEEKETFEVLLRSKDNLEDELERRDLIISINEALKKLNKREKIIIENFFGLNGKNKLGLEEIGELLELTRERCRQIKNEALKKMKKEIESTYFL